VSAIRLFEIEKIRSTEFRIGAVVRWTRSVRYPVEITHLGPTPHELDSHWDSSHEYHVGRTHKDGLDKQAISWLAAGHSAVNLDSGPNDSIITSENEVGKKTVFGS